MSDRVHKIVKAITPEWVVRKLRELSIIRQHKKVADFWNPIINSYFEGNLEKYNLQPKKQFNHSKIIWQYWGQGIEENDLPEIIQICFSSVDKFKGDYQIIRLTDDTVNDYIELPDFVLEKKENPAFTRTFFSDLLRLALLDVYGGIWLDATILLTGSLPEQYERMDYFVFQRSDEEKNKRYWENVYAYYFGWHPGFKVRVLNSIIFAKEKNIVISTHLDLLLHFWKTEQTIPDYFFFQILYNEVMNKHLFSHNCPVINDCIPHIIQTKINGNYEKLSFTEALTLTSIHKMAYYDKKGLIKLKDLLRETKII